MKDAAFEEKYLKDPFFKRKIDVQIGIFNKQ